MPVVSIVRHLMGLAPLLPGWAHFPFKPLIGALSHATAAAPTLRGVVEANATQRELYIAVPGLVPPYGWGEQRQCRNQRPTLDAQAPAPVPWLGPAPSPLPPCRRCSIWTLPSATPLRRLRSMTATRRRCSSRCCHLTMMRYALLPPQAWGRLSVQRRGAVGLPEFQGPAKPRMASTSPRTHPHTHADTK